IDVQRAHAAGAGADQQALAVCLQQHDALAGAQGEGFHATDAPPATAPPMLQAAAEPAGGEDQQDDAGQAEQDAQQFAAGVELAGCRQRRRVQQECDGAHQRSLRTRSAGLITSVRRMPNFSLITTTSAWATRVPLTKTSNGSPAARSSSTTEPWLSCSRLRMLMRVRPTSMARVTGTSRIMSRWTPPRPVAAPCKGSRATRSLAPASAPAMVAVESWSAVSFMVDSSVGIDRRHRRAAGARPGHERQRH